MFGSNVIFVSFNKPTYVTKEIFGLHCSNSAFKLLRLGVYFRYDSFLFIQSCAALISHAVPHRIFPTAYTSMYELEHQHCLRGCRGNGPMYGKQMDRNVMIIVQEIPVGT